MTKQKTNLILAVFLILLSSTPNSFAQAEEIQNPNKIFVDYPYTHFSDMNFDPATAYGPSLEFMDLSYEGLVTKDPKNSDEIICLLATNWSISSDGKTYTFTLRKDVSYFDGKPFNA